MVAQAGAGGARWERPRSRSRSFTGTGKAHGDGFGSELTILEFAEAVRAAAGGGGKIVHRPMPMDDPKQRKPDISRAQRLLGWGPQVPLEEGLNQTIAWFRRVVGGPKAP